jgi:hypothetical protein
MHPVLAQLSSLAAVVVAAAGAMGCSSSSPTPAAGGCGSATVSFSTDVMPVFQTGCTLSNVCHGQMSNAGEEDLYLGDNAGGTDPTTVYSMLVGKMSVENPQMPLVDPAGTLANSFLWHKVNGDQNSSAVAAGCSMATALCTDCNATTPCGGTMPYLGEPLAADQLCTIQNWITQGAKSN